MLQTDFFCLDVKHRKTEKQMTEKSRGNKIYLDNIFYLLNTLERNHGNRHQLGQDLLDVQSYLGPLRFISNIVAQQQAIISKQCLHDILTWDFFVNSGVFEFCPRTEHEQLRPPPQAPLCAAYAFRPRGLSPK